MKMFPEFVPFLLCNLLPYVLRMPYDIPGIVGHPFLSTPSTLTPTVESHRGDTSAVTALVAEYPAHQCPPPIL